MRQKNKQISEVYLGIRVLYGCLIQWRPDLEFAIATSVEASKIVQSFSKKLYKKQSL